MPYQRIPNRNGTRFHRYISGVQVRFRKTSRGWWWYTLGWPTMQQEIGPFRDRAKAVKHAARFINGL